MNDQPIVVGYFQPSRLDITLQREPEIGIAWMACCDPFGLCGLGKTRREACDSLLAMLNKRGIAGQGYVEVAEQ